VQGTVLCVDDDRDLCNILARALAEDGYGVVTAFDGQTAVDMVTESPPSLVLLDLILPRKDGFAVLESIRALDGPAADTPVIVLSGCTPTPEYSARALALGAVALLVKPVPLDELLETVRIHAGEGKPEVPVGPSDRRSRRRTQAPLAGTLERLAFPALLHHLHGMRANGVLAISHGRKRKWLQMRDGLPVAVRSNLVNECLGNFLVRTGRITQAQAAESRRGMESGELQGEVLVGMDVLSESEMTDALRAQADEKLFEAFSWDGGSYEFEKGAELQRANTLGIGGSPANLILRGMRERFPRERIDAYIHDHADCFVAPGESAYYRFQEVDLDPAHEAIIADLDGTRRLSEFADADEDVRRAMCALVAMGLVELRRERARGSQPVMPKRGGGSKAKQPAESGIRDALQNMLERFRSQTLFEILGVDAQADESVVREAYSRLAESSHPDRFRSSSAPVRKLAEEAFAHITRAYETLVDPRRRGRYVLDRRREERNAEEVQLGQKALRAEGEFRRGEALLRARAYEEALICFGRALELYPEEGDYYAHYGWALYLCHPDEISIAEEAIEHVKRGLKLASHREKPYLFLGRLFKVIGHTEAAEKMFVRAARVQPECHEAMRELRLINMRRQKTRGLIGRLFRR
jgi:CheY-like chemotaxis protein